MLDPSSTARRPSRPQSPRAARAVPRRRARRRRPRTALKGADEVVHLAAIVGDPACARDPELSHEVNVEGTPRARRRRRASRRRALRVRLDVLELRAHGRPDRARSTRTARWRPVSLYAEQKVGDREGAARGRPGAAPTCLRFATVYGVGAADALRPHRQRVHARSVGGPRARGLRRAVLAPVRARARRRPRGRHVLDARRQRGGRASSTSAARTRTTASSTSSR